MGKKTVKPTRRLLPAASQSEIHILPSKDISKEYKGYLTPNDNEVGTHKELHDYMTVLNYYQGLGVEVTKAEWAFIPVAVIAYLNGAVGAWPYIGSAKKAAKTPAQKVLYPTGAFTINLTINGYFFTLVIGEAYSKVFCKPLAEVNKALSHLQGVDSGARAKIWNGFKTGTLVVVTLGGAILAAFPNYALSAKVSGDPPAVSMAAFISGVTQQYVGTQVLLQFIFSCIAYPAQLTYRRYNVQAMARHRRYSIIESLKSAHKNALSSAQNEIMRLVQIGQDEPLQDLYSLLRKNPTREDTEKLVFELLKFAKDEEFQEVPWLRRSFEIASMLLMLTSLPGLAGATEDTSSEIFELRDLLQRWATAMAIFLVSIALSVYIAKPFGAAVYQSLAYSFYGIKRSWNQSAGVTDFIAKGWENKFNREAWSHLVKLPLSFLQNPIAMSAGALAFYFAAAYSVQTTVLLNEQVMGQPASKILEIPAVLFTYVFNIYPGIPIASSAQEFLTRAFGSERNKEQIKLQRTLTDIQTFIENIDDDRFIAILSSIKQKNAETPQALESLLEIFFGNKKPSEVIPKNHPAQQETKLTFEDIIDNVAPQRYQVMRDHPIQKIGFFGLKGDQPIEEGVGLLVRDKNPRYDGEAKGYQLK
ncbi:MAG: hypothetical protein H0U71_05915 [Gammaproteobacteria bacterium]|nr:hypothetical protein [Gammaproteobacteria bacterium]